ncbi:hypothetical protein [Ruoffia sp. FAM 24228]|uniref:hypothetical protein n=1 Tax=Ruoffia sp. FAM 24228 TaxID=3259517 RepID=UPI0038909BC9
MLIHQPKLWSVMLRLLLTAVGQVSLIYLWMLIPGQEAIAYFLLLILMSAPVGTIINLILKKWMFQLMNDSDSFALKIAYPFIIIIGLFITVIVITNLNIFDLFFLLIFVFVLSLPLLLLEMLFYIIRNWTQLKE